VSRTFFPDVVFAWVFCLASISLCCIAAWTDTRRAKIPNRLTVFMLATGLVANAARGGWLGAEGKALWVFETGSAFLGICDGLLFAFVGFTVSFAVMFTLWIFGTCGGGDVKLIAAIGAWVGIPYLPLVWLGTVVASVFWMGGRILLSIASSGDPEQTHRTPQNLQGVRRESVTISGRKGPARFQRVTYSVPLVVSLACVLLGMFRYELQIETKPQPVPPQNATAHVRPTPATV
jgi:prepilin peptidase CpaA